MASTPKYEPFSTYYLHPLQGDNYEQWSKIECNNLHARNKLGFLDGTISISNVDSADYAQRGIVNSMLVV
ncbi:Topoisomerase I damage affected protein 11 [Bienertia sinuspersici]